MEDENSIKNLKSRVRHASSEIIYQHHPTNVTPPYVSLPKIELGKFLCTGYTPFFLTRRVVCNS